ncbi:MAG: hypothetical protein A2097_02980 [Desulfobacula sp. GWF2_41_7]|nr:MAG: hypothetical protein A2097_02980 [Desulfobacula sp. GWF2_41_7]
MLNIQEKKIIETIDSLTDDMIEFAIRLVAEPSTLGHETCAVTVMKKELDRMGFSTSLVPLDRGKLAGHPGFAPVPWSLENRNNLIGILPAESAGGNSALFNGHLDVVSAGNPDFWTRDPFSPTVIDGWLYGRGSGDMKSGIAAMVYGSYAVKKAGFGLCAPLTIEGVIEEECSGNGAIACLAEGYDAKAVLIPEPFGPTILTDQLGVLWFKIKLSGRPAHVQKASSGINAIEKCYTLIDSLRHLEVRLNESDIPAAYTGMEHPINLNIGVIEGGDWPSTVPSEAQFHARLSFFPEMSYERICSLIEKNIRLAAGKDPWLRDNPPVVEFYGFRSEGHSLSRDLPAFKVLDDCHRSLTKEDAKSYVSTCTTDLRAFHRFGSGQPTCYGPVAENIHGIDERVHLESVINVARAYALFIARWCRLAD